MNDLVITNEAKVPVTTSLKVAECFGKEHKNVLRDITVITNTLESQGISQLNFEPSDYVSDRGQTYPMFQMTRKGFMLLVMGFTGSQAMQYKSDFIDAFDAMEKKLMEPAVTTSPADLTRLEILQMAMESEQKAIEFQQKIAEDKPKVDAFDHFMVAEGVQSLTADLKSLGLKPNVTLEWMRSQGYLYKQSNGNIPYANHIDRGLFVVKCITSQNNSGNRFSQSFLTTKGIERFSRLKREGAIPEYCFNDLTKAEPIQNDF